MSDRFYANSDFDANTVELTGPESHHLTHVLRKRVGEIVTVFNGRGLEATGEIVETGRRAAIVQIADVHTLPPDTGVDVTLAVAVPKGERFRWLVEKSAELGVRRLIPLRTERSTVDPGEAKLAKMRQTAIETAKQCGAARLMEIADVIAWADFAGQAFQPDADRNDRIVAKQKDGQAGELDVRCYIAHPGGEPQATACRQIRPADSIWFLIGPEGGFTRDEVAQATATGAIAVDLGRNILRTETAAIALAAWARLTFTG